jgi:HK97 family phage major capsid protein
MNEYVTELLSKNVCVDEIISKCAEKFSDLSDAEIVKGIETAKRAFEIKKSLQKSAQEKRASDALNERVEKAIEAKLKEIKVPSLLEKSASQVEVSEPAGAWRADVAKAFRLKKKQSEGTFTEKDASEMAELCQKAENVRKSANGLTPDIALEGGNPIRIEFDQEVDKLVYTNSQLLDAVQIRQGTQKTQINGLTNTDFTFRANTRADYTEQRPDTPAEVVEYKTAGQLIFIDNDMFEDVDYNLVSELTELASDAKIRLLEPLIASGDSSSAFLGINFSAGVTALDCINISGGSGTGNGDIVDNDLSNMYAAAASQGRNQGVFILDTREWLRIKNEKDSQGMPINAVSMVNGQMIHNATGRPIISSDLMSRTNNALVANTGGTDVTVLFGSLPNFRIYQKGQLEIATSTDYAFASDETAMRVQIHYKQAMPSQSSSKFVTLQGVKNNPLS